ncbi:Ig-like domain-containing protein [Candidatus Symbiobacter mobilis]|uniref:Cadherin domain protein n=1 Tax=Candidatus Symbiobacter mobilis CR TaxID=946483 RepID=U5ND61_9BURK|nr:Ig-like domain-containing protein [Candidatus Symbiobacter mobilis]AGX88183.1 cadherin domain protein [Candidatus Symbiobacter mobilis CR]
MKYRLLPVASAAMMLVACGGSGSGSDPSTGGVAVDGYLQNSTVLCDATGNWQLDSDQNETTVPTNAQGQFVFSEGCQHPLMLTGGKSTDTQLDFVGMIKAPALSKVISPLTTLLVHGASAQNLLTALELDASTALTDTDPMVEATEGVLSHPNLARKTLAVQQILQKATEVLATLAGINDVDSKNAIYDALAAGLAQAIQASPTTTKLFNGQDVNQAALRTALANMFGISTLPTTAKNAVAGVGGAAPLAAVLAPTLAKQADAYIDASNQTAGLTQVTMAQQTDTQLASKVQAAKNQGHLGATTTEAAAATLGDEIAGVPANTPLTLSITDNVAGTATGPVIFTFTFSEDVSDFALGDITVDGVLASSVGTLSGSGKVYTLTVSPAENTSGTITVRVAAGAANNAAGKPCPAQSDSQTFDRTVNAPAPTLEIGDSVSTTTATGAVTFTFTFNESVTGFARDDITVTGVPEANVGALSGSGSVYTLVVTPPANTSGTINIGVREGAATNGAGKTSPTKTTSQNFDTTLAPTLNITDSVSTTTATGAVTFTFTFSESVTGFARDDITVTGVPEANVGALSGSGSVYTLVVTPPANTSGTINVSVREGAATNAAGKSNATTQVAPQAFDTRIVVDEGTVLANFESIQGGSGGYSGAQASSQVAPTGGTGNALQITKPASADIWGGAWYLVPSNINNGKVPFATGRTVIAAKVYSPIAGSTIKLKVTAAERDPTHVEVESLPLATANAWQTVYWDFTGIDVSKAFTTLSITPDPNRTPDGKVYYIDDIRLAPAGTVVPNPTAYLYIGADNINVRDAATTRSYTLAQFESTGINVPWPVSDDAAIRFALGEQGTVVLPANLTVHAAVSIEQVDPVGHGLMKAYIKNVQVTKTGTNVTITVPTTAEAKVFGTSWDGENQAIVNFTNSVKGITNTLTTAASTLSNVVFGDVVNWGINGVGSDFAMSDLYGKYKVTIVLQGLPLRKAGGGTLPTKSIEVPTLIQGGTASLTSSFIVTGPAIEGTIILGPKN